MRSVRYVCLFVLLSWSLAAAEAPRRYVSHTARVPDEYIVTLSGIPIPQAEATARALGAEYGLSIVYVYKHAFAGFHCKGPIAAAQRLAGDARVQWVEENSIHYPAVEFFGWKVTAPWSDQSPDPPTDPQAPPFEPGWTLRRISQRLMIPANERGDTGVYGYASGGEGVRAYIVDSAVLSSHVDFGGRVEPGYDAMNKQENTVPIVPCGPDGKDRGDCDLTQGIQCNNDGHGTAVASLLGGNVFGVAPGVTIVPVRVIDCNAPRGFDTSNLVNALDWIAGDLRNRAPAKGAVINLSMEGGDPALQPAVRASLAAVVQAGGVIFSAAGNNPSENGSANSGDACINSPARYAYGNGEGPPHVISVSGTDVADARYAPCPNPAAPGCGNVRITEFSYGKCVDIFAPGVDVRSAAIRSAAGDRVNNGERRESRHGTSFATPHVAGVAARLLSERNLYNRFFPGLTSDRVWNALRETATPGVVNVGTPDNGTPASDTPNRMVYIGGITITAQPYIATNIPASGSTPAKARLRVEANPRGATLNYTWYQGDYAVNVQKQNGTDASYDAPRDVDAKYWVRIEGTYTINGASRTLTADSAILEVTKCLAPQTERPRIDILQGSAGKRLLQASVEGNSYTWYTGPYTDPKPVPNASTSSIEVAPDVITPYWFRVVLSGDCTLDSAIVDVPAVCPLSTDILITRAILSGVGTEVVRMAEEGTSEVVPRIRVPAGGNVALTMKTGSGLFSGRVDDARWFSGTGESRVQLGQTKTLYYRNASPVGIQPLTAVVKVGDCETARRVDIDVANRDRLNKGVSVVPLINPVYKRDDYKKRTCTTDPPNCPPDIKIRVDYSNTVRRVEWRRSAYDDSVRPLCPLGSACALNDIVAKIEDHPPTGTGDGYSEITIVSADSQIPTVGPGQYWARLISAGSDEDRGLIEDSDVTTVQCQDCKSINRIRGLIKVGGQEKTHIYKNQASDFVTLDVPEHVSGQTYEWRKGEYDDTKPVESTQPSWHTDAVGDVWVRTTIGQTATDSHLLKIEALPATPVYVTVQVTPGSRAIGLERDALIEATATGFCSSDVDIIWYSRNPDSFSDPEDAKPYEIDYGPKHSVLKPTSDVTVWVRATSDTCDQTSAAVEVTIIVLCEPVAHVTAITNPLDRHVAKNELVSLAGVGFGKEMVYSWFQGPEGDDNASTLIAHGPGALRQPTTDITYWVRAQDSCGNVDTDPVTLYVCKPTINAPLPETLVITAGNSASVTVDASPAQPGQDLTYQWHTGHPSLGGTPIPGQTTSTLLVSQAGEYFVTVRGSCPDTFKPPVNSTVVRVSICNPPVIQSVSSTTIAPGGTGAVSVNATGSNLTFQWYRGDQLLAGETQPTLTASPSTTTSYRCHVTSDGNCTVISDPATITVCAPPTITSTVAQPARIRTNQTSTLTVTASGALTYQWHRASDNAPISGATASSYTTPTLTEDTGYWVRALNGECKTDSPAVTVTVCNIDVLLTSNKTQITTGESATLTAAVSNARSAEIFYKWYIGQSGDTSQPLAEGPGMSSRMVSPSASTSYWVNVSDGTCNIDSPSVHVVFCNRPTVTTHPQSTMIDKTQNPNASTTLTVAATGQNLTYQWYYGQTGVTANPVPGATSPSLTVSPNSQTSYWARVSGSCGVPADSDTATVTLCQAPAITAQPMSIVATANVATQIEVTATGTNLSYAWYRGAAGDTTNPVGGNSRILPVSVSTTTQYWVRISGTCGSMNSNAAFVSIAPAITTQPVNHNTTSATSATFSVVASGSNLTYQWFNSPANTAIAGATAATYTTPALTQDASYYVRVTSGIASVTSNTVTAVICQAKNINVGQSSTRAGSTVTLSIVSPDGNQTYTWYQGAMPSTAVNLGTGTAKAVNPDVTTQYWALNSGYGCYSGRQVTVTVCEPRIATQPAPTSITAGQNASMSVVAAGPGPFTYQWYAGATGVTSSPVSGQTTATLTVASPSTISYWVRVTGSCGTVDSNAAQVTVCQPPAVTTHPQSKTATANVPTQIEVQATGTNLSYAWFRGAVGDTSAPVGTNSNILTVTPADTRLYWVRVSNSCGTVNSNGAWVMVAPVITTQPVSRNVTSGGSLTFTVVASGTELVYQWYQHPSNVAISGATGPSYTTPALTSDASYYVRVWSGWPYADSNVATATVCQAKAVNVSQPSQLAGSAVTLSIVNPDGNQSYSWYQGAVGNTSNHIGNGTAVMVYPTQTTQYWVLNAGYNCYSNSQQITVNVCYPRIDTQPQGAFLNAGQSTTLTVAASGTPVLTYQWYYGVSGNTANPVPGATSASLTVSPASTTNYWVRVTSAAGSGCVTDSATALVRICIPPAITLNPAHTVIYPTDTVTIGVTATGDELTYQWYEYVNNTNVALPGQTSSTLVIQPGTTRRFWVRVTGRCGVVDSIHALQSVRPQINTQPVNVAVCSGNSATFSVGATGSPDMQYRWYYGPVGSYGTLLGSNASVSITNVTSATSVWCEVSSGQAFVPTQLATATVQSGPPVGIAKTYMGWSFTYTLTASVPPEVAGYETYQWYRGPLSDTASSTTGPASQSWMVDESSSTQYWVRVTDTRTGCRTDKGVMVPW